MAFAFGHHVLDVERRELRRGSAAVALEPQVFDVLAYLLLHRDRLVSKDDLLDAVWGGRIVSELTMTSRINAARKAIGDSGATQELIRTIPRRGFRFVGEVTEDGAPAAAPAEPGTMLPLPLKPSVAILPFQNMSGDPEQEYFADGMVEEITSGLSRVRDFFVIARNSAFSYKGKTIAIPQVSRELGVRYVIEGSVRKHGDRLRITAQLIDGLSGTHLWADRYDGAVTDVFDLQDRITESVVGAIQPSVRSAEVERSRRKRPENLDAYDLVLRAYPGVWSLDRAANADALRLLGRAIAIEPTYPLALSLAAWCHAQQVVYGWADDPERSRAEALCLAQTAAEASGEDPTILTVLSAAHTMVHSHGTAARLLEKALALDPNSAWAWNRSGWLQAYLGHPEAAIEHCQRALRLSPFDPMNFNAFFGIGAGHFVAERYADCADWQERGLIEHPGASWIYRMLVPAYVFLGRDADAQAGLCRLLDDYPGLTVSQIEAALVFSPPAMAQIVDGLRKAGMAE